MTRPVPPQAAVFVEDVEENGVPKLTAYWDGYRAWTIGWGHTGPDIVKGTTCTRAQADAWEIQDLSQAAANVERVVHVPLNDNQFAALISFDFNEGDGALDGSTLLRQINAGNFAAVPGELARWVYAKDNSGVMRYSAGLATRRTREAALFNQPAPNASPLPPIPQLRPAPIQPLIPDAPPNYPMVAQDPDNNPQVPLTQSTTIWSSIGMFMASGGGMVLGYVQSPYALVALGMVLLLAGYVIHERMNHRKIGGV